MTWLLPVAALAPASEAMTAAAAAAEQARDEFQNFSTAAFQLLWEPWILVLRRGIEEMCERNYFRAVLQH